MKRNPLIGISSAALLLAAILVVALPAAQAKNISANIKGTLDKPVPGDCPTGYPHQCASGTCGNIVPIGTPKITGTFGKGTITALCITIDVGNNVNVPADTDGKETCSPIFGDMTVHVSVTKNHVTTVTDTAVNVAGVFCHHQANSSLGMIEAGFGIDGANSTDTAATGWGTLTGTSNKDTGATSLKMKGSLTP